MNIQLIIEKKDAERFVYQIAIKELEQAIQKVYGKSPKIILENEASHLSPNSIILGRHSVQRFFDQQKFPSKNAIPESYQIRNISRDNGKCIVVLGYDQRGDIYGMFKLAEQILVMEDEIFTIDIIKSPEFKTRIATGPCPMFSHERLPDWYNGDSEWRSMLDITWMSPTPQHSRTGLIPSQVVHVKEFKKAVNRFKQYCIKILSLGYNGVLLGGINHLVLLHQYNIYSENSEFSVRNKTYQKFYREMIDYCSSLGIEFYFRSEEVSYTKPMENIIGEICPINPKLWEVYKARYREVFNLFPEVKGIYLMSGDLMYKSFDHLAGYHWKDIIRYHKCKKCEHLSDVDKIRVLAENTYDIVAKECDKLYIHSTWSWGGLKEQDSFDSPDDDLDVLERKPDIRSDPSYYDKVFSNIPSKNFVVAMWYTASDFYLHQPLNPNLGRGDLDQAVITQTSLEFQAQGLFPCFMAEDHRRGLIHSKKTNGTAAITFVQDGSVLFKIGPPIIMYFLGFSHWLQINHYAEGRLYWDINEDSFEVARDWAIKEYGKEAANTIAKIVLMSTDVISKGLYIRSYAKNNVMLPVPWIRWMLVFGGPLLKDIYEECKESLEETINEGIEAFHICKNMIDLLKTTKPHIKDKCLYKETLNSLVHEASFMETIMYYRECFLRYYQVLEEQSNPKRKKIIARLNSLLNKLSKSKQYYEDTYDYYQLEGIDQFFKQVEIEDLIH